MTDEKPTRQVSPFESGLAAHQAGLLEAAAAHYMRAVSDGDHVADALNNLASLAVARGRNDEAAAFLDRALTIFPRSTFLLRNRANAALALGRPEDALRILTDALAIDPGDADLAFQAGNTALQLGKGDEAHGYFARAATLRPGHFDAQLNLGGTHFLAGRLDAAQTCFERALAIDPAARSAIENLATIKIEMGRAARRAGDAVAAETAFRAALAAHPDSFDAKFELANLLTEAGYSEHGAVLYEEALRLRPDHADLHSNLGHAYCQLRRYDAAVAHCRRAIELGPQREEPHINLGAALHGVGDTDAALRSFDVALKINPRSAAAHTSKGNALFALGRFDEAATCNENAIDADPEYALAHVNLGVIRMLRGDYEGGWPEYDWRWRTLRLQRKVGVGALRPRPPANLRDAAARSVLVTCEQGLGDSIQFVRYIRDLAATGARVTLLVQKALVSLFEQIEGVELLTAELANAERFDYVVSIFDLGRMFWKGIDAVPARDGYLRADPVFVAKWSRILGPKIRPRVGLVWSGSTDHPDDANRSHRLATLTTVLSDGIDYISLQKEVREVDRAFLGQALNIRDFAAKIDDFADTAALCELVDLVVTVDTSVAHLAGALGRPARLILPIVPDWRWSMTGETTHWYGSVRLLRQTRHRDWRDVYDRIAALLSAVARGAPIDQFTIPNG
ncbi:MAG: tetratricopeptide repeat protein [Alphaproteobacteria bacterium]|nr:tetratricopeptide repeat protein [Alphaproteobacteria bacterium]